jgi:hypothetical protein
MTGHRENFDHFRAEMVADPATVMAADFEIHIDGKIFTPGDPPGVGAMMLPNMAHYQGVVLSVHFVAEGRNCLYGSAVMVAPGIAFMATHVLEQFLVDGILPGNSSLICLGYTPFGMMIWRARKYHRVDVSDVTILSLEYVSAPPPDGHFAQAMLTTRLPRIGEQVMIVGLRASDQHVSMDETRSFPVKAQHIEFGADLLVAVGEVTEHHLEGRWRAQPGQIVEVATSTPGCLSGGPTFGEDGRLIGVLTSSFDHEDGRGPSYVSLLRTAMAVEIEPFFIPHIFGDKKFRLLGSRWCEIEGREAVRVSVAKETGIVRVEIDDTAH